MVVAGCRAAGDDFPHGAVGVVGGAGDGEGFGGVEGGAGGDVGDEVGDCVGVLEVGGGREGGEGFTGSVERGG